MSSATKRDAQVRVRVTGGGQASITITGQDIEARRGVVTLQGPRDYVVIDEAGVEVGHVDRFGPAARMLFRHYGLDQTHAMRTIKEKG